MPDDIITLGEIARRLDQIDTNITGLTKAVTENSDKLTADFYHLADLERRTGRLERLLTGVAVAVIGVFVEMLMRLLS